MKSCRVSKVLRIGGLTCALILAWHAPTARGAGWDPGVPSRLFKDGQTNEKKPKPTHRLAPAPEKCPNCQPLIDQLQAALDDWAAMQYADGEKNRKDAGFGDDAASTEKRDKALAQMADALAALGQPADNGKAAQAKQKTNAKDPKLKDSRANKEALAKEIKRLTDLLQECLDKCGEEEKKPVIEKPGGGTSPTGAGGEKEGPSDGEQPGTGGKEKKGGVKELPKLPTLPDCWKDAAQKKKFNDDLDAAEQELLKLRGYYGGHGGFTGDNEVREAEGKKVNDALKKVNDLKEQAEKVKDCPKTKAMLPGFPKQGGENVGLPGNGGETCAFLVNEHKIKIDNEGTGETIGHVADLIIENLTDQPLTCVVPPMVLESGSGKNQHYACPESHTVRIDPHGTVTVPMNGVCIARNKPPVGKGVTGDLMINQGHPAIVQNPHSHISTKDTGELLRLCSSKYKAAEKLQKDGAFKDFPYHDKQKQLDIVVQWLVWSDPRICEIAGAPPAKKEDSKKVIYKQVEEHGPMTTDTKKKIDKGADTMWDGIELAGAKAKDLEPEETPSTTEEGVPSNQPEYVGQTQAKQPTPTPAKPKPGGGKSTAKDKTTPKPVEPQKTEPKKEEPKGETTGDGSAPQTEEKPKEPPTIPSYPFTKETDCGTITISVGEKGELVFDFKPKKDPKCPCKEFGWIQHLSNADYDAWHYDNGVLSAGTGTSKTGAKSDPSLPKQPTTPAKGKKLKDWDNNPWYGGTTDPKKPKDFDEHPTPQTHVSDKPDAPNTKYKTQLVCVATGEVLFTWEWGPFEKGNEAVDKVGGKSVPPP